VTTGLSSCNGTKPDRRTKAIAVAENEDEDDHRC
jgi:hypothetical protein